MWQGGRKDAWRGMRMAVEVRARAEMSDRQEAVGAVGIVPPMSKWPTYLLTCVRVYLYKRCIDGLCSSGVTGAPRNTKVLCLHLHMCGTACADGEVDRPAPPRPPQEQVRVADWGVTTVRYKCCISCSLFQGESW